MIQAKKLFNPTYHKKHSNSLQLAIWCVNLKQVLDEPSFVGRERELKELQHCLESAKKGTGLTVFVSGEAGSGKTRLITEFLNVAKEKDVIVLAGWCLSDIAIPYFPFVEAFDSGFSINEDKDASEINLKLTLKSWLLETNQSEPNKIFSDSHANVWKDYIFHKVAKELLFLSAKKPLILFLDDIHWADSASLSLLHYLAHQVASERILILATFRNEELETNLEGYPNPLSKLLLLMGRDGLYHELSLSNLNTNDVGRIAESMLRGNVDCEFVAKLTSEGGGNPLFVVESLRMFLEQGSLSKKNCYWTLNIDDVEVPRKVKDIILHRLSTLESSQRKILDAASVVGERFDPKLVASVVLCSNADVLIALDKIAKCTLMVHPEDDGYRFDHAKFREMLYNEIPPLLRKEYHLEIAEAYEVAVQHGAEVTESDLAYHFVQAGAKQKAVKYSLQAGKVALSQFSNAEAIKHFSYVASAVGNAEGFVYEKTSALEGLGDAFLASSMFRESIRMFENLASATEADAVRLRAYRKAMDSAFLLGDNPLLMELVKRAEPLAAADRLENARILMNKGRTFHLLSNFKAATEDMESALQVFEKEYSLWDVAIALIGLGVYHAGQNKMHKVGIAESIRSLALFKEVKNYHFQLEAYWVAGQSFIHCLLLNEALEMFDNVIKLSEKIKNGDYQQLIYAYVLSSRCFWMLGNFEKLTEYNLKALELSKKTDSLIASAIVYSSLIVQYTQLGDLKRAEDYFNELVKLPKETIFHPHANGRLAMAIFLASKGEWEKSNQQFTEFREFAKQRESPYLDFIIKLFYAWALEMQNHCDEAKALHEECKMLFEKYESRFDHGELQAHIMAPEKINVDQTFEMRLDIVNVSRNKSAIVQIENALNPKLKLTDSPQSYKVNNDVIYFGRTELKPFELKTIKFCLQSNQPGEVKLSPKVIYIDDLGKTVTCSTNTISITIQPTAATIKIESPAESQQIELKTKYAQKAFEYLINAFLEDYKRQKMPLDTSGWRTLMEIVKDSQVSKHSIYGRSGRGGKVITELKRLGLIESRFFTGEPGRGGRILKIRICHEKENIRKQFS